MVHGVMKNKPSSTVYISNLSYKRDRNGLRSLFAKFGTIKNIKIIVEPETNQSRGMAFVEMSSVAEAKTAIEALNGKIIDGRTAKANYATPLKPGSVSKLSKESKKTEKQKDLNFKDVQKAKKARNEGRRKIKEFVKGKK